MAWPHSLHKQQSMTVCLIVDRQDRSSPEYQDDTGTLAASLGYQINKQFSISLDALNLNDPILKYYAATKDQPRAFYENGRQYYLTLRVKL